MEFLHTHSSTLDVVLVLISNTDELCVPELLGTGCDYRALGHLQSWNICRSNLLLPIFSPMRKRWKFVLVQDYWWTTRFWTKSEDAGTLWKTNHKIKHYFTVKRNEIWNLKKVRPFENWRNPRYWEVLFVKLGTRIYQFRFLVPFPLSHNKHELEELDMVLPYIIT